MNDDVLDDKPYVFVYEDDDDDAEVETLAPSAGRGRLTVDVDALVADADSEFSMQDQRFFFERMVNDYQPWEIGLELGWSAAKINRFTDHPERSDIIFALSERDNEGMERALKRVARSGNVAALRLWLFNRAPHRGWSDTRHVKVDAQSRQELVVSVRTALDTKMGELVQAQGELGIAALQAAFLDEDIIEGEIVE